MDVPGKDKSKVRGSDCCVVRGLPSPRAAPGGSEPLSSLTWPIAHFLWLAGQICSFPSLEQSVAPQHWKRAQAARRLVLPHPTPFKNENESRASWKEQKFPRFKVASGTDASAFEKVRCLHSNVEFSVLTKI